MLGGVLPAIEAGFMQQEIIDASYQHQQEVDSGQRNIVAVNKYQNDEPLKIPILAMDPQGYDRQVTRLNQLRQERDNAQVHAALESVRVACQNNLNVMPALIEAAKAYATLGEITDVMRQEFGVYKEPLHI
jgi:methylmalonyl-CoA mutase N-terminal domain/subunit